MPTVCIAGGRVEILLVLKDQELEQESSSSSCISISWVANGGILAPPQPTHGINLMANSLKLTGVRRN
jgi:hypothetical protein